VYQIIHEDRQYMINNVGNSADPPDGTLIHFNQMFKYNADCHKTCAPYAE